VILLHLKASGVHPIPGSVYHDWHLASLSELEKYHIFCTYQCLVGEW